LGLTETALDPGAQLADGGSGRPLRRSIWQNDLDAGVGVHVDPHPSRA
jgi:hypothetical protein